jgi:hypothetical protein
MKTIRELVRHAIDYEENLFKIEKYITKNKIGEKFFIVLDNETVLESDYDSILDRANIKLAFAFLKISYQPKGFDESYLSPIIIGKDQLPLNRKLVIKDWVFDFKGQDLLEMAEPINLSIYNNEMDVNILRKLAIEKPIPTDQLDFKTAIQLCIALSDCTSKESVQFVMDQFSKKPLIIKTGLIDQMQEEITRLKVDLADKDQIILNYKNRLDSIEGIART